MTENTVTVIYLSSKGIEKYIDRHPVSWSRKSLSQRGGIGDSAGPPPTSSVSEFFLLVAQKQGLFTQEEYRDFCFQRWNDANPEWFQGLSQGQRDGLTAKLYRNFYPSGINTIHAWALLVEAQWFDLCVIDTVTDTLSKHDLIVSRSGLPPVALDLFIGSESAVSDRQYKLKHRKSSKDFVCVSYDVPLPMQGRLQRRPGNMRWYCLKDFEHVYAAVRSNESLWDTPFVPCTCGQHEGRVSA